ncbi:MAG: hypothetical protein AAGJ56_05150 [Myxococcota bacterium]
MKKIETALLFTIATVVHAACGLETTYADGFQRSDDEPIADVPEDPADPGGNDTEAPSDPGPPDDIEPPTSSCEDDNTCERCPRAANASVRDFEFGNLPQTESSSATLRVEYVARITTSTNAPADGFVALSSGPLEFFPDASVQVRFAQSGNLDVRDFDAFAADAEIPYRQGEWYHFIVDVDLAAQNYDVAVRACDGDTAETLISGARFRDNELTPASLDNVGFWAEVGSGLELADVRWGETS